MKQRTRRFGVLLAAAGIVAATAAGAWAVTVTAPSSNPFTVPSDASGNPQFFNITATGFSAAEPAFVQQCDGVPSSTTGWSASEHCDLASGNSPVNANGSGAVTFEASDPTARLNVFKGPSPQELFNCLSLNDPALSNGLPNFRNCQVRVSGGTPGDTTEQAFFSIVLPDAVAATTTTSSTTTTTTVPTGGGKTHMGDCSGAVSLVKLTSPTKGAGLTDATQDGIKAAGGIAKDQGTKLPVNGGGSCTGHVRPGDPHNPGHLNTETALSLTPKAQATSLLGNATCAQGADATNDTNAAAHTWPLSGKITWTFNETYFDPLANATKPYKMQADVTLRGSDTAGLDVFDVGGVVLSGVNAGAMVSGAIWQDPVTLTHGTSGYNTGYELDMPSVAACADGIAGNAHILQELIGGGGTSATSLLGSAAPGLSFEFGQ